MTEDKVDFVWIVISGWYTEGEPFFTDEKVSASDRESAQLQFDLMDVYCMDVIRYVENDKLFI